MKRRSVHGLLAAGTDPERVRRAFLGPSSELVTVRCGQHSGGRRPVLATLEQTVEGLMVVYVMKAPPGSDRKRWVCAQLTTADELRSGVLLGGHCRQHGDIEFNTAQVARALSESKKKPVTIAV